MRYFLPRNWIHPTIDQPAVTRIAEELHLKRYQAETLFHRQIGDIDEIRAFLEPSLNKLCDPIYLKDIVSALERIEQALQKGEKLMVFGDYDVDGITATVLLTKVITFLGGEVIYYLPSRFEEGYGLSLAGIEKAAEEGVTLIITVDCGSNAVEEALAAKEKGIDLIITDHHEVREDLRPECVALINPKQSDCEFPDKNVAGIGVALKLAQALLARFDKKLPLSALLRLTCLGTIADVVPLVGENRIIARYGLAALPDSNIPGIQALLEECGLKNKAVTALDVGFRLGPRLNAAGRLEHATKALEIFMTNNEREAKKIAVWLSKENAKRQQIQQRIFQDAVMLINSSVDLEKDAVIVLAKEGWHRGVVGIVASKIVERFGRPAVIIGIENGEGYGSCRSIEGFHLHSAIKTCEQYLEKWGGHSMAAGLTIKSDNIATFREALKTESTKHLLISDLKPLLRIDAEIDFADIGEELMSFMANLAPFGRGNPEPVFVLKDVKLLKPPFVLKDKHLKFEIVDDARTASFECVAWGMRIEFHEMLLKNAYIDIAFTPEWNYWSGRRIQLNIKDIKPSKNKEQ